MPLIRSISGLRATLDDALQESVVRDYTASFATLMPEGAIVVGRDGRPSGTWIEREVVQTLLQYGRQVRTAGIVPTPTVQLVTERSDAVGAIIITASHNPAPWNGLKFLASDGVFLDAAQNEELWRIHDTRAFETHTSSSAGSVVSVPDAAQRHIDAIHALPIFDAASRAALRALRPRIVVDAVNCSGSLIVPALLNTFGVEVVELFCLNNGEFPHTPEPIPQNLHQICDAVRQHEADLGLAVDPDADRLVIIDAEGQTIGEEKTVMLAIEAAMRNKHLFGSTPDAVAVVNLSTSRMALDAAVRNGGRCEFSAVGEINVVRRMQQLNAIVGGEGSGGVILPACHMGRDSLVGCALLLWLMSHTSKEEWTTLLRANPYAMIKRTVEVAHRPHAFSVHLSDAEQRECTLNREDGLRVDWQDKWVQLRASNTEPIVRIIAEAPTAHEAEQLVGRAQQWLE